MDCPAVRSQIRRVRELLIAADSGNWPAITIRRRRQRSFGVWFSGPDTSMLF